MKVRAFIAILSLVFIANDCVETYQEPKPDYITVNVLVYGEIYTKHVDSSYVHCRDFFEGMQVRIDIIKAGGERYNLYANVSVCAFKTQTVSFKLYREQPIEVSAYAEQVPGQYTQVRGTDYLTWDEVYPKNDFGDTYNYTTIVDIIWLENP